ncbi:MAG: tRNA pseudouridine(13) synthase TruD [Myxococcota bacterium]|nr:tRNA pseudouridine(13) synthase TruD [Myxococcota bacterium]
MSDEGPKIETEVRHTQSKVPPRDRPLLPLPDAALGGYLPGTQPCPWRSDATLSIGGTIGATPEDFVVEERPLYLPSGEGQHWMSLVLKRDQSSERLIIRAAEAANCRPEEVGYAGRKDRRAVTLQWLTTPAPINAAIFDGEGFQLLGAGQHRNKLKLGHLGGNQFTIRLEDLNAPAQLPRILKSLAGHTLNYFGHQRFGRNGENLRWARRLLERPPRRKLKRRERFALSALQSAIFNQWLGARVKDGLLDQLLPGDVCKPIHGGSFIVESIEEENARLARGEIELLGPLPGPKLFSAQGPALERERALFEAWGLDERAQRALSRAWRGGRRAALVPVKGLQIQGEGRERLLTFRLPPGAFATTFIGELIKGELRAPIAAPPSASVAPAEPEAAP